MNSQRTRNKYDTLLVWMFHNKKEHLLPESIRNDIPYSTSYTWLNTEFNYTGSECREILNESLSIYELFYERKNLKSVLTNLAITWIKIEKIIKPVIRKSKEYRTLIINEI